MKKVIQLGCVTGLIGFMTFHTASAQTTQTGNNKAHPVTTTATQTGVGNAQMLESQKNEQEAELKRLKKEKQDKQVEKMQARLLKKKKK